MFCLACTGLNGTDKLQIPVIDISDPDDQTADDLVAAVANSGFVFIRSLGTGFDADLIDDIFGLVLLSKILQLYLATLFHRAKVWIQSRKFFHSPKEEKAECSMGTNVLSHFPVVTVHLKPCF